MNIGALVKPSLFGYGPGGPQHSDPEEYQHGIILDLYEDDYGIYYYEVYWKTRVEWWKEGELELVNEGR